MDTLNCNDIKALIDIIGGIMRDNKENLCEIDSRVGDGDLGLTMSAGFTKAAEDIAGFDKDDIGKLLAKTGMVIAQAAPSTMGTLMASGFMAGGKSISGKTEMGAAEYAQFVEAFVESLMKRGKSKPGEKTIIDAMYAAANSAKAAGGGTLKECTKAAEVGAKQGLEATKDMMATHGKAAVFREKTIGIEDPGATVGWMLMKAFSDFVAQ